MYLGTVVLFFFLIWLTLGDKKKKTTVWYGKISIFLSVISSPITGCNSFPGALWWSSKCLWIYLFPQYEGHWFPFMQRLSLYFGVRVLRVVSLNTLNISKPVMICIIIIVHSAMYSAVKKKYYYNISTTVWSEIIFFLIGGNKKLIVKLYNSKHCW